MEPFQAEADGAEGGIIDAEADADDARHTHIFPRIPRNARQFVQRRCCLDASR